MNATGATFSISLVTCLALTGCTTTTSDSDSPAVVVTTTILGSVVGDIAECGGVTVETLMPVGVDPHDFSASSEQVAHMAKAQLVVANGLGLEGGLADAITSAEAEGARVMEVAPLIDPLSFGEASSSDSAEDGSLDPHFWNDISRMAEVATLVGKKLAEVTGDGAYAACGDEVHDALLTTDQAVRDILSTVSAERRVLVTDHDAFGYFADAYDFEIAGVIVPGGSTLAEASSQDLAALVDVIREQQVPAIFSNIAVSSALADTIAAEAGTSIAVVALYVGSLGPKGSGAENYSDMMITNAQLIADALG
ncbi:metal ABC transporter substrate-binding protein [Salinibacterium sp. TMP30]|uniref:metal ABC transporter substrate-binding protein n=1 Tax=Salinibacterium sp. TMP30 TaxID=3138237 RepID=UPI0031386325